MTEKRFVYYEHKGADYILDTPNESLDFIEMLGDCLEAEEIVDLLNKQHEQIERLKENFRALDEVKCEIADENEQLKQRIKVLEDSVDGLAGTIAHFDLDEVMWSD